MSIVCVYVCFACLGVLPYTFTLHIYPAGLSLIDETSSLNWIYPTYTIVYYIYTTYTIDLGPCQGPDPLYVTPIKKKCRKIAYFSQKLQNLENLARPYI